MSGVSKFQGLPHTIRSLETNEGPTKQEITTFNPDKHIIVYEGISGLPFFLKSAVVEWSLVKRQDSITDLKLDFEVKFKGVGIILTPLAKVKLGKLGDEILSEFKFYVENGTPHERKLIAKKKSR
jgi:hypothetical protein